MAEEFTFHDIRIEDRSDRFLSGLIARFVGRAAVIASQIGPKDTGFYRENVVGVIQGDSRGALRSKRVNRDGYAVERAAEALDRLPEGTAAVVGLADYSEFVERKYGTIRTAIARAQMELPAIENLLRED